MKGKTMTLKRRVHYEWDIETVCPDGDILDHNHADRLRDMPALEDDQRLVLVRDLWQTDGDAHADLEWRLWAYVDRKSAMLPAVFDDCGEPTEVRVPKRFHREIDDALEAYRAHG